MACLALVSLQIFQQQERLVAHGAGERRPGFGPLPLLWQNSNLLYSLLFDSWHRLHSWDRFWRGRWRIAQRSRRRPFFSSPLLLNLLSLLLLRLVLQLHHVADGLPLLVVHEAGGKEEVHVKVGSVLIVHVRLEPEDDKDDEEDDDGEDDELLVPVCVEVPVGDHPSAEKATDSASRWKAAHLAFEYFDKKVLALGRLSLN